MEGHTGSLGLIYSEEMNGTGEPGGVPGFLKVPGGLGWGHQGWTNKAGRKASPVSQGGFSWLVKGKGHSTDDISTSQETSDLSCHLHVTLEVRMGSWKEKGVINGTMRKGGGKWVPYAFAMQYNNNYFRYYWYYHFCINESWEGCQQLWKCYFLSFTLWDSLWSY